MYCVKCGVKLADTEKKCPLCETVAYHPDIKRDHAEALYPKGKMPKPESGREVLCGVILILFMIPIAITFFSDILYDGELDWFGYVAGGLAIAYLTFAFPMWFQRPNPVILVPCNFAACAGYLLYVDLMTGGGWFLTFAFPLSLGVALITCTLITLLRYLRRGRLYVIGGSIISLGALAPLVEFMMDITFGLQFMGWSLYPWIVLTLLGGLFIYFAINSAAREKIERKIFF